MARTKKVKAAGRFGAGYGVSLRRNFNVIEQVQRKKQKCPHCSKLGVKRLAAGIWHCGKCGKTFAGDAYALNGQ